MTKVILSTYVHGEFLSAFENLYVTSTGSIGTSGVFAQYYHQTVVNDGRVTAGYLASQHRAYNGVFFDNDATLINGSPTYAGALISGLDGVYDLGGAATVTNYGTIRGVISIYGSTDGVLLEKGGSLVNGSAGDRTALVEGAQGVHVVGALGAVANFGAILGSVQTGVGLYDGGNVTNGALTDPGATIGGATEGVDLNLGGTVTNFGTIVGSYFQGVVIYHVGRVINGAVTDTGATISGATQGVDVDDTGTVTNFGTISSLGASSGDSGVIMPGGGALINGAPGDRSATVDGYSGAQMLSAGSVTNYGTLRGLGAAAGQRGVYLAGGGSVINGSGADRSALIDGATGVLIEGGAGSIRNSGTISANVSWAVDQTDGGSVINGSLNNAAALIQGYSGLRLVGGSATNFGAIGAVGDVGQGVELTFGASITNGASGRAGALIEGYVGVYVETGQTATVTNFGSIDGAGGAAVSFGAATDVLNVEAGSSFVGAVEGGRGILDLASGAGTIVLAGSVVTVLGSMAATAFSNFGTVRIAAGASFKVAGNNTGLLQVLGGTLTSDGTVSGTGHVYINGGVADFGAGFEEAVDFTGTTGELELGSSKTYTGKITGFSLTGTTSLDLLDIAFAGTTTAVYTGTTTSGVLTVTEGVNTAKITLEGNYLTSTFKLSAAPGGGTLVVDPTRAAAPVHVVGSAPTHQFVAAMAGFEVSASGSVAPQAEAWPTTPLLVAPRMA